MSHGSEEYGRGYDAGERAGLAEAIACILEGVSARSEIPDAVWADAISEAHARFRAGIKFRAEQGSRETAWWLAGIPPVPPCPEREEEEGQSPIAFQRPVLRPVSS